MPEKLNLNTLYALYNDLFFGGDLPCDTRCYYRSGLRHRHGSAIADLV